MMQSSEFFKNIEFFNPNICHECKENDNGNFITCNQCHMISYCSDNHRLKCEERHMKMCEAIQNVLKNHNHLQFWSTYGLNLEQWIQTRKQLIGLVKLELQRDLEPYEVQMITLAKSCIICYRQTEDLLHCLKCYSINYCSNHKKLLGKRHRSNCKKLRQSIETNRDMALFDIVMLEFDEYPDENIHITDMESFIGHFVYPRFSAEMTTSECCNMSCYYSDCISGPLTLYYGILKIKVFNSLGSHFVIHILNASIVDRDYLPTWELLLHHWRYIKYLKIILIGSELHPENGNIMLCTRCIEQYLHFEIHRMLYHNYVDSEYYKQPNLIIGFQVDLSDWETLSEVISKIRDQKCPFLLTSKSKHTAEQNVNKIKRILKSPICDVLYCIYNGKNKFSSLRPYRDYENGDNVCYLNKYLTVYQRL